MKKAISSRQNPLFKRIREAIRDHAAEIVIEGPKQVADALRAGWTPIAVATRDLQSPLPARGERGLEVTFTADLFDALAETKTPQNMIALFERPRASASEILGRRDTVAVALDGVQDPGNVGTIVRLAAAFDAAGVLLLPGCADAFGPKAIRSSAGAILSVPVASVTARELLARPLFVADMHGESIDPPARDAVLVFGSEGAGVSEEIRSAARAISIAMSGRVESLNVAASAAILLSRSYAARR
ncbi:MAG TPA: RNA methyltransferase [Thermoanaerobaculia bacterium]|nr:RNA methyltransferase [Thermoanaerobaculia bacterium]